MGSVIYDFLNDSFLLDPSLINESYTSVPVSSLINELRRYREHCISHLSDLNEEIKGAQSNLSLCTGANSPGLSMLMQAALYVEKVVVPDPLFSFTTPVSPFARAMTAAMSMPTGEVPEKDDVARAAKKLLAYRPMVAAGYVHVYPVTLYTEPPQQVAVRYSKTSFSELLAPNVLERYTTAASITSAVRFNGGLRIEDSLYPCRTISICFDDSGKVYIYALHEQRIVQKDDGTRTVAMQVELSDSVPPIELFNQWVKQSTNQAAADHFGKLANSIAIASHSGGGYLCQSQFEVDVLRTANVVSDETKSIQTHAVDSVLKMQLEVLDGVSAEDMMTARADTEAFALFRREYEKQMRELRAEQDPEKLKVKTENAMHELTEVQLTKVSLSIKSLRKKLLTDAAISATSFASSIVLPGPGMFSGIVALAMGYKHYSEYQKAIHENPAYFLWKAGARHK